jgi:glycosyltransferase involved in cell wall biosynthesis
LQRIIVSVTNDLATDQRVRKVCDTLNSEGFEIVLIGRKLRHSLDLDRPYKIYRMQLFFTKGFAFYAEYNLRLFIKLFFTKKDILLANDLDTLLPNYLISKIFRKKLVYDSHELFTEVPELTSRPKTQNVWLKIEKWIFPKLKNIITVNQVIANIYQEKYQVPVHVIRNISLKLPSFTVDKELTDIIKANKKMLILQGSGINKDRGAEEAVEMMQYLKDVILVIVGGGDVFEKLKEIIKNLKIEEKVKIIGKVPYDQLLKYTQIADLGLSLDKGTNLNYEYSLPNKVFDFIQCQVPMMVSNRRVVAKLIQDNEIGVVFNKHNPKEMAQIVREALDNKPQYKKWKQNLVKAAQKYNWENESIKIKYIYNNIK